MVQGHPCILVGGLEISSAKQLPWSGVNSMACVHLDRKLEPNLVQEGRVAKPCFIVPLERAAIRSTFFLQRHPLHFN